MRGLLLSFAIAIVAACGGSHNGESICANTVPPPAACMTSCDPTPMAPDTCVAGYHCTPDGKCDAQCTQGGTECGDGYTCDPDGNCMAIGACSGIMCNVATCNGSGQSPTTIMGTVYAPNGTLPLYGVTVYVPNSDPGPFADGAQCSKCSDTLPGDPIVQTQTIEDGSFILQGIPSGDNIPVVVTIGKWRRQIVIPHVDDCTMVPVDMTDTTLPKSQTDMTANTKSVDIPRIAISTGSADALECLIRKLGIADTEIGTAGGTQRIQLYSDLESAGVGVSKFDTGTAFADSKNLWDTTAHLSIYDIVILSCEGQQASNTKPQSALDALKAFADLGGRVFLSHWHNIWIEGATQDGTGQKEAAWTPIATWDDGGTYDGNDDLIDESNNPKGMSFATWMINVMGSMVRDHVVLTPGTGKSTLVSVDESKAQQWVYTDDAAKRTQNLQFVTPVEGDSSAACGKVVFSDMHVSGTIQNPDTKTYPSACTTFGTALSPQEKALAFMLFDISSCVGVIE
jgi:hypothetical protein